MSVVRVETRPLWALIVVAMLMAGCGGTGDASQESPAPTDAGTGSGGTDGDDNETEEPPPAPQELLNETLDYARAPEQMGESTSFDVPAETVGLRLSYQPQHDCPTPTLGYQDEAAVVFASPDGEEHRKLLFDSGAGSVDCNNVPPPSPFDVEPSAGTWEVRTEGVYSGMVHVTALANPVGA